MQNYVAKSEKLEFSNFGIGPGLEKTKKFRLKSIGPYAETFKHQ